MALKIQRDGKPGLLVAVEIKGDRLRNCDLIPESKEPTFINDFPVIEGAKWVRVKIQRTKTTLEFWRNRP